MWAQRWGPGLWNIVAGGKAQVRLCGIQLVPVPLVCPVSTNIQSPWRWSGWSCPFPVPDPGGVRTFHFPGT